jgi:hypothetical protein
VTGLIRRLTQPLDRYDGVFAVNIGPFGWKSFFWLTDERPLPAVLAATTPSRITTQIWSESPYSAKSRRPTFNVE